MRSGTDRRAGACRKGGDEVRSASGEEYGEFLARPAELVSVPTNDIMKSLRLSSTAKVLGQEVFNRSCASCHGADLKGGAKPARPI